MFSRSILSSYKPTEIWLQRGNGSGTVTKVRGQSWQSALIIFTAVYFTRDKTFNSYDECMEFWLINEPWVENNTITGLSVV